MKRKLSKELWALRFEKMLALEKQSAAEYEALLAECRREHNGHPIEAHLQKLIHDENRHTKLVEQLLRILHRQPE